MSTAKLIAFFTCISSLTYGQYVGDKEINLEGLGRYTRDSWDESGYYHGRMADLWLYTHDRDTVRGLFRRAVKSPDQSRLIWKYQVVKRATLKNTELFLDDKSMGVFFSYYSVPAIKADTAWSTGPGWELAIKQETIDGFFFGDFIQASNGRLKLKEIQDMPLDSLRIMRNEIFARYGYKFRAGGEMEKYFKTKPWYYPQHDNVDRFLTDTEKRNITLILGKEKELAAIEAQVKASKDKDDRELAALAKLKTAKYAGTYSIPMDGDAFKNLTIYPETDQSVLFHIGASLGAPGYNSGQLTGRMKIVNGKGEFTSSFRCIFTARFTAEGVNITVIEEGYNCYMGNGISIGGLYYTDSKKIPLYYETHDGKGSFKTMNPGN